MTPLKQVSWHRLVMALGCVAGLLVSVPASAGPIPLDTWLEFGFTDAGVAATGCDPADPAGGFCIESSGTPTTFLDAPAWTFVAPAGGATLTVTDAFESGDRFEIFNFGVSLGVTSLPARQAVDCGDDPVTCLATAGMSIGTFVLAGGNYSLTIVPTDAPTGGGAGYFFVESAQVPEPATALLVFTGFGFALRRARARAVLARRTL
jgi:hypothetical protein